MLPVRQNLRIFAAKTAHMDIYDIIARRSSVRDYADTPLSAAQVSALEEACAATSAPFGGRVAVRLAHFAEGCARRPGTYGVIHGARSFMILSTDGSPAARLSAGYEFERILLEATRLGLGTCWMAATFRGSVFAEAACLSEGMEVVAVSPVGVPSGKRHLLERITRSVVRENTRLDFDRMFFSAGFSEPVPRDSAFFRPLEAVRRAPSAMNAQPWRALVDTDGARVHFYSMRRTRSRHVALDMGIALCHFQQACRAEGIPGQYECLTNAPIHEDMDYLTSYLVKKS